MGLCAGVRRAVRDASDRVPVRKLKAMSANQSTSLQTSITSHTQKVVSLWLSMSAWNARRSGSVSHEVGMAWGIWEVTCLEREAERQRHDRERHQ